ncbi:hypothetical protein Pfo_007165, partial [Paulownia fortunei]
RSFKVGTLDRLEARLATKGYNQVSGVDTLSSHNRELYHLRKALSGLRQAPRPWFSKFSSFVVSMGFINYVSQFMQNPTVYIIFQLVKHILRYVQGTISDGIKILKNTSLSLDLYAFSDADWAGCLTTHRSPTRFCTYLWQ